MSLDEKTFRFLIVILLFGIFWVIVTDYHFEMPEELEERQAEPMTAQDKAVLVWAIYILSMIAAWSLYFMEYGGWVRDVLRSFWKRRKEKNQQAGFFSQMDEEASR